MLAAIHRDGLSGDEGGFVGGKEQYRAGDLFRLAHAAHRNPLNNFRQNIGRDVRRHVGFDIAGRNRVHRDALGGRFAGEGFGKTNDTRLGR